MLFELKILGRPAIPNDDDIMLQRAFVSYKLTGPMDQPSSDRTQWGAWLTKDNTEEELNIQICTMALAILKPYIIKEMEKTFVD